MLKEIKNNNLNIDKGLLLVDFYATWCGPCRMMHPVIDSISSENDNLTVAKVDVDENEELARQYGIMSVPTFLLFKDGKLIDQRSGFMPKEELTRWIESH